MGVTHHGDAGYYRYRGTPESDAATRQTVKMRKLLRVNRQRIEFNASSIRPLSVRLNQHVAQALRDGLKVTRLAQAAGLSRWTVRTIRLTFDDLVPSGLPADHHIAAITGLRAELEELEESKASLEERRLNLMVAARRLGVMDDFELAALSGLQRETIRKMTWGLQPAIAP